MFVVSYRSYIKLTGQQLTGFIPELLRTYLEFGMLDPGNQIIPQIFSLL